MKARDLRPGMVIYVGKWRTIKRIGKPLRLKHDPHQHRRFEFTDGHHQFIHPGREFEVREEQVA